MSKELAMLLLVKHTSVCLECRNVQQGKSPLCTPASFLSLIAKGE